MALDAAQAAALKLLEALRQEDYSFTPVTPETHRRVTARPAMAVAPDLRGALGWSRPFDRDLLPDAIRGAMEAAGFLVPSGKLWRSRVRVSEVRGLLFIHSAFPTDEDDSVFLGPDSVRFASFLSAELEGMRPPGRLVDIGAGAGVGGIVAAKALPGATVELADINPAALRLAEVNAAYAGVDVLIRRSDGLEAVAPGFGAAVANPPFIHSGGPVYRDGGAMLGAELSLRWALEAAAKLAPGGRLLMYTGSAIVDGRDQLREELEERVGALGAAIRYGEIDPDIFGKELEKPGYDMVERIAAVGVVIEKSA